MLGKHFHIGKSETKSCISFKVPQSESDTNVKHRLFRDPARLFLLFRKLAML
jgi:hypothetical protein